MKARSRLAAAGMLELLMDDIVGLDDQSREYEDIAEQNAIIRLHTDRKHSVRRAECFLFTDDKIQTYLSHTIQKSFHLILHVTNAIFLLRIPEFQIRLR